jgi:hypothetical protein
MVICQGEINMDWLHITPTMIELATYAAIMIAMALVALFLLSIIIVNDDDDMIRHEQFMTKIREINNIPIIEASQIDV